MVSLFSIWSGTHWKELSEFNEPKATVLQYFEGCNRHCLFDFTVEVEINQMCFPQTNPLLNIVVVSCRLGSVDTKMHFLFLSRLGLVSFKVAIYMINLLCRVLFLLFFFYASVSFYCNVNRDDVVYL